MNKHYKHMVRKAVTLFCCLSLLVNQVPTHALAEALDELGTPQVEQQLEELTDGSEQTDDQEAAGQESAGEGSDPEQNDGQEELDDQGAESSLEEVEEDLGASDELQQFFEVAFAGDAEVQTFATLGEALSWVDESTQPATITLLDSYAFQADDARSIELDEGQVLTIEGNEKALVRTDGAEGSLLDVTGKGQLVLRNCVLDGAGVVSEWPLLSVADEVDLVLQDTQIANHASNTKGVCAVNAYNTTGEVRVSGTTVVSGNTAAEAAANLAVSGEDRLVLEAYAGDALGITTDKNAAGDQFAVLGDSEAAVDALTNDLNAELSAVAAEDGAGVVWQANEQDDDQALLAAPTRMLMKQSRSVSPVTVNIPLTKVLKSNKSLLETRLELEVETFDFNLTSNPAEGASITLTSGAEGTIYELPVTTLIDKGQKSGQTVTYTAEGDDSPWNVTFTKEGTYVLTVSEVTDDEARSYDMNYGAAYTLTYHVVEEEGVLRVAESYKSADYPAAPTKSGTLLNSISVNNLFNISTAIDGNGYPATVSQTDGVIAMQMYQNSAAVITSQFSLDFSRSFSISGRAIVPGSDCLTLAFQDNHKKQAFYTESNNALDPVYYGGSRTHAGASLIDGYTVSATAQDKLKNTMDSMSEGFILQYVSKDAIRGFYSYRINGNNRVPYAASSGLKNGSYDYSVAENSNKVMPYSISFECSNHETGVGKLTIKMMGNTIVYNNFVASNLMPNVWRAACLTVASNVDHAWSGGFTLEDERYSEELGISATTSFWADRNNDGVYETQVNTTDSPAIPGETILVRHGLTRADDYDVTYYERVLIRQLQDVTDGTKLTGREAYTYPLGNSDAKVDCLDVAGAFNTDDLTKALSMTVFPADQCEDRGINFEYKVTAPKAKNHTVTEQALFGQEPFQTIYTDSYGFRTENLQEQKARLENEAKIYDSIKLNVTCKTTGCPIANAQFAIYGAEDDPLWTGTSDAAGNLTVKPTGKFKPRTGSTFTLKQLTTGDSYLLPQGSWSLVIGSDDTISTSVNHAANFDAEHPDWTLEAKTVGGVIQIKNHAYSMVTVKNEVEAGENAEYPAMVITDVAVCADSLHAHPEKAYVMLDDGYQTYTSYLQQETGSTQGNPMLAPGETLSLLIPDRIPCEAYHVNAYVVDSLGGVEAPAEGDFTATINDSKTNATITSTSGTTTIKNGGCYVTGTISALKFAGCIVKGGSVIVLGGRMASSAYLRVQNHSFETLRFRLTVDGGAYGNQVGSNSNAGFIVEGEGDTQERVAVSGTKNAHYYEFEVAATRTEQGNKTFLIPFAAGKSYKLQVFQSDGNGGWKDVTDNLKWNHLSLSERKQGSTWVSDALTGELVAGPAYSWRSASDNSFDAAIAASENGPRVLTNIAVIDLSDPPAPTGVVTRDAPTYAMSMGALAVAGMALAFAHRLRKEEEE